MSTRVVRVVAGILIRDGHVLIAERSASRHGAGLWEFPGGKPEAGEDLPTALHRELREELDIEIGGARAFCQVTHEYPGRHVDLHFFTVAGWRGEPRGAEGQRIEWVSRDGLGGYEFLAANAGVVSKITSVLPAPLTLDVSKY